MRKMEDNLAAHADSDPEIPDSLHIHPDVQKGLISMCVALLCF
jgi:hypothetical protein